MEEIEDYGPGEDVPPAIPAATTVVFRHDPAGGPAQLLLVERAGGLAFAGGATVFPGGKVDPADHEFAARLALPLDPEDAAARVAAVRETLEETGLVVAMRGEVDSARAVEARRLLLASGRLDTVVEAMDWTFDAEVLVPFARWCPRHRNMRIFDTRFYLTDIGTGAVDVVADAGESRHLFWASAAEALALADRGEIRVIYPTRRNLERLAQFGDFGAARAHALAIPPRIVTPRVEERNGERWLVIPQDAGYPVTGEPLVAAERR